MPAKERADADHALVADGRGFHGVPIARGNGDGRDATVREIHLRDRFIPPVEKPDGCAPERPSSAGACAQSPRRASARESDGVDVEERGREPACQVPQAEGLRVLTLAYAGSRLK